MPDNSQQAVRSAEGERSLTVQGERRHGGTQTNFALHVADIPATADPSLVPIPALTGIAALIGIVPIAAIATAALVLPSSLVPLHTVRLSARKISRIAIV